VVELVLAGTGANGVYRLPLADPIAIRSVPPARKFDIDRLDLSIRTR
jgi:hypothetical protein